MNTEQSKSPLAEVVVLDLTRMLPGAVLARQLIDLGARVIKVEDPGAGDPMRSVPPLVGGIGVGFAAFYRGAESITLDLRDEGDAGHMRRLASRADVLVESFRPGTLDDWGLGWGEMSSENPRLVWCALSSFGTAPEVRDRVAHDLNLCSLAGVLDLVGGRVPGIQLADITSGILASTAILTALFARERDGRGARIEQPLAAGPLPFLTWGWAERAVGGDAVIGILLGGGCPCYRVYRCGDGRSLSLAALEPKFWTVFVEMLELPELGGSAFAVAAAGEEAAAAVENTLAQHPREHWLRLAAGRGLPMSAVHSTDEARAEPAFASAGLLEKTPLPGGGTLGGVGPSLPDLGNTPERPAPQLGEHTEAVLAELAE